MIPGISEQSPKAEEAQSQVEAVMYAAHAPFVQGLARDPGKVRRLAFSSQAMEAGHWLHAELEKHIERGHTVLGDSVLCDRTEEPRFFIDECPRIEKFDKFADYAAALRDDVENGVKTRQ